MISQPIRRNFFPKTQSQVFDFIGVVIAVLRRFHSTFIYTYTTDSKELFIFFVSVLHKDMCYHCLAPLKADAEFLMEQQNVFIIRDPARAILSHHAIFPQMPVQAIGHQALYEIFCEVRRLTGKTPWVINAEDLASRPEHTVRRLCDHLQLDFMPDALNWNATCPEQWKTWRGWHKDAENSTSITAGSADFDERPLHADSRLLTYYQLHRPFYERMNQFTEQGQP